MASDLTPGWYILTYHNVAWEESPLIGGIGGTCPPDVFRDHVQTCASAGTVVSVQEGFERLRRGDVTGPLFSFWFDDGLRGVREYAAPILAEHGVTGAHSVCSRFSQRTEVFWRFKLSCIHWAGADAQLRARLRPLGLGDGDFLRRFTLDHFSDAVLAAIEEVYAPLAPADAFELFDTPEQLTELHRAGWVLANHSAAHYPLGEEGVEVSVVDQFMECEPFLSGLTGQDSAFWVLPFDRNVPLANLEAARAPGKRAMVLMRDRVNRPGASDPDLLYRIHPSENDRHGLMPLLRQASANP